MSKWAVTGAVGARCGTRLVGMVEDRSSKRSGRGWGRLAVGKTKKVASALELRGRRRERGGGSSGEKILAPRPARAERIGERHTRLLN